MRDASDVEGTTPDERLHAIAGRWNTAGYVIGDPEIPVAGSDDYEVLAGGYFVLHRVDVTVRDKQVRAVEVIGEPDPESGGYLARSFDSDCHTEVMHVTIDEKGVLRFSGGPDVAPAARSADAAAGHVRSTLVVAEDRRSMTALWERSEDGIGWQPWMNISFARRA
jgi:hypothetical protein